MLRNAIENDIIDPNNLTLGEALLIIRPTQTYIVQEGDSLESIADDYGIDLMELLRNNPNIANNRLSIGEELVISYEVQRIGTLRMNGIAFPYV